MNGTELYCNYTVSIPHSTVSTNNITHRTESGTQAQQILLVDAGLN